MALLVHICPEPQATRIRRNGIAARRMPDWMAGHDRFVWAFPVLPSYTLTHQWMRELKRLGQRTMCAVTFRLPDDEPVFARHYRDRPAPFVASAAVGYILQLPDPRGAEIIIPRRIEPAEIVSIRIIPKGVGWRYFPEAKNRPLTLCDCPMCAPRGEVKSKRFRERIARQ